MNILELCLSPGLGGLELYVFRASTLLGKQHTIVPVVKSNGKLLRHFKQHSSLETHCLDTASKWLPLLTAWKLAKLIDKHDIDILHMHWGNDLALAALAKRLSSKKPALVYTRQMQITRSKNDIYHNYMYKQMDLMLTITKQLETIARAFIAAHANKIHTLYYGVDIPQTVLQADDRLQQRKDLGFNQDDFVIGLFGRLEDGKGQHLLLDAIAAAAHNEEIFKAIIVGHEMQPGYREILQSFASERKIAERVVFMDFVNEPQKLMQLCDCVVLASYSETFGLVLPEAMRCGIAVIGSNSGGVPEIIDHKKTGLLFQSHDADSLYHQLSKLYNNLELRQELAKQGQKSADRIFNNDIHYKKLEQHFEKLAG